MGRVEKELALTPCRWEEEERPLFFPIYAEREAPWRREVVWGWRRSGAGVAPTLTIPALLNLKLLNPRFREALCAERVKNPSFFLRRDTYGEIGTCVITRREMKRQREWGGGKEGSWLRNNYCISLSLASCPVWSVLVTFSYSLYYYQ